MQALPRAETSSSIQSEDREEKALSVLNFPLSQDSRGILPQPDPHEREKREKTLPVLLNSETRQHFVSIILVLWWQQKPPVEDEE